MPSTLGLPGPVAWVPVDLVANVLVEVAGVAPHKAVNRSNGVGKGVTNSVTNGVTAGGKSPVPVYHVVSPTGVAWEALAPGVAARLGASTRIVPWGEWMDTLRHSVRNAQGAQSAAHNPALKLMDFLEMLDQEIGSGQQRPALEVKETLKATPTLAQLKPAYGDWMGTWMEQWGF